MSISLENISLLLSSVMLERIKENERVPIRYAGFRTESLLRIHVLPYLFPVQSFRHLAFEVAERPELQNIVGLKGPESPSRATLWHFRNRNSMIFRRMLARSLAIISVEALQKGIQVNFSAPCVETLVRDAFDDFTDASTEARISILMRPSSREKPHSLTLFPSHEFPESAQKKKVYLHDELEFPMLVRWRKGSESLTLCVDQPSWTEFPDVAQDLGEIFGRAGKKPYTACNIIVMRSGNENSHILLSKRLIGSGKGTYALPGGKMHEDESIRECVARELKEEVGLDFRDGCIVSDRVTNEPGFPRVRSIGVIATDWSGSLKKREPETYAHSRWEWHAFSDLPSPLFFPTKLALDDYLAGKSPRLPLGNDDLPLSRYWR